MSMAVDILPHGRENPMTTVSTQQALQILSQSWSDNFRTFLEAHMPLPDTLFPAMADLIMAAPIEDLEDLRRLEAKIITLIEENTHA
mgnify:CR=1 FL=1